MGNTKSHSDNNKKNDDIDNDIDNKESVDDEFELLINKSLSTLLREVEDSKPSVLTRRTQINIYIVYFSVFLDNMGVSIVQPILPFYAAQWDVTSVELAMLYSSYSLMATFATIFMAKMSDKFGRRPMIIFSLFGTMSGFLLTGLAWNYESLLAFRFYTGAFGGSFSVAQAYVADVCPPNLLEKYLAGIGGVMAIAFIIGPLIGGWLAQYSLSAPFFASAAAGAVGFIVAVIWLQESYFPEEQQKIDKKKHRIKELQQKQDQEQDIASDSDDNADNIPLKTISTDDNEMKEESDNDNLNGNLDENKELEEEKFKIPVQVWMVLISYFMATIGWTTFTSMFAQYLMDEFGLNTSQIAFITVVIGTVYVIANVVIFTFMAKIIGIYWLAAAGLVLFAVSLGLCPVSGEIWGMLIFMCLGVGIGNGVIMPCMAAMGADYADEEHRGTVLGLITVGNQAAFVVGPLIMGALYAVEHDYIFYVGAGFVAAGFIPIVLLLIIWPETRKPKMFKETDYLAEIEEYNLHPEKWKYIEDKPSKSDYSKFGKEFGKLLVNRGYKWKTYYKRFIKILDNTFPHIRTDNWKNYYEDNRFIRARLEQTRWDFEHVKELQQISLMGEGTHTMRY